LKPKPLIEELHITPPVSKPEGKKGLLIEEIGGSTNEGSEEPDIAAKQGSDKENEEDVPYT